MIRIEKDIKFEQVRKWNSRLLNKTYDEDTKKLFWKNPEWVAR